MRWPCCMTVGLAGGHGGATALMRGLDADKRRHTSQNKEIIR